MTATVDQRRRDLAAPPAPFTPEQEARIRELIADREAERYADFKRTGELLDRQEEEAWSALAVATAEARRGG